ncbi:hypothetical protein BASA81_002018 [Batrachochytrium salamandrivorans]|nr:hypothetical protein BASA81_002018 [Batrachochytrium salamandrivorans]
MLTIDYAHMCLQREKSLVLVCVGVVILLTALARILLPDGYSALQMVPHIVHPTNATNISAHHTNISALHTTKAPTTSPSKRKTSIAFLVPVISTTERSEADLPIFTVLLPTLFPSLELDKYDYGMFLGYDTGDRLYDNSTSMQALGKRFHEVTLGNISLQTFGFNNTRNAPCWVWNGLFELAYKQGFDYFFQINDDLTFEPAPWTSTFVSTLEITNNLGVVGPWDINNNQPIMTQSFVHRTHYDIFHTYYPPEFRNWYSDNWISIVYAKEETTRLNQFKVRNGHAGVRYRIHYAGALVERLDVLGKAQIAKYKGK